MINYYTIQTDIKTILQGGTYSETIKEIMIEGMERDMLLGNMPLLNIRLVASELQVRSLPNGYYGRVGFEIDVITFNLSEFRKAAITRDTLLKEIQLRLQSNRQFSAGVETSVIGPRVIFGTGTATEGDVSAGHIAFATFDFVVEVFIEPA